MPIVTPMNMNAPQTIASSEPVQSSQHQTEQSHQNPVPDSTPSEAMSPQFAALARKEKILRQQAQQIKAERDAMKSRESEIENQTHSKWKERLVQNPWDVLLEAGLTPEQATNLIINQPQPKDLEFQNLQKELKAIKQAQEDQRLQAIEHQKNQYEQAKKQIHNEVKLLVDSDESYETIKEMAAHDAVTELVEQTFAQNGYLMPIEEAAKEVEEYLLDQALRLTKLKKIQSRLTPSAPQRSNTEMKQSSPTLTNRIHTPTTSLSAKERRERAILAFEGKL